VHIRAFVRDNIGTKCSILHVIQPAKQAHQHELVIHAHFAARDGAPPHGRATGHDHMACQAATPTCGLVRLRAEMDMVAFADEGLAAEILKKVAPHFPTAPSAAGRQQQQQMAALAAINLHAARLLARLLGAGAVDGGVAELGPGCSGMAGGEPPWVTRLLDFYVGILEGEDWALPRWIIDEIAWESDFASTCLDGTDRAALRGHQVSSGHGSSVLREAWFQ
jgi:hypothetical protein